jgi:hypothetical protein
VSAKKESPKLPADDEVRDKGAEGGGDFKA